MPYRLNDEGKKLVLDFVAEYCKTDDPLRDCKGDPSYGCGWFDYAVDAAQRGNFQFEIAPFYTKSGHPIHCDLDPDHFDFAPDDEY